MEILSLLTDSRIDNCKEVWRGAKIIMIKKNNIKIHFLGWDKRWDTTIDVLKGIYNYHVLLCIIIIIIIIIIIFKYYHLQVEF